MELIDKPVRTPEWLPKQILNSASSLRRRHFRWMSNPGTFPVTTSITCHAVIVAIALSGAPIPEDRSESVVVELISSDVFSSIRPETDKVFGKRGENPEALDQKIFDASRYRQQPKKPSIVQRKQDSGKTSDLISTTTNTKSSALSLSTEKVYNRDKIIENGSLLSRLSELVPTAKPSLSKSLTIKTSFKAHADKVDRRANNYELSLEDDILVKIYPTSQITTDTHVNKFSETIKSKGELTLPTSNEFNGIDGATATKGDPEISVSKPSSNSLKGRETHAIPIGKNPKPVYPAQAKYKGWQGRVILEVEVLSSGTVGFLSTYSSSGHGTLDQAAIQAIRKWRFTPARLAGIAVSSYIKLPVRFQLRP